MLKTEIKHLLLIKTVAETGNITKAAEKLCLTQSAISQQLSDIEERLDTSLFHRTKKKMLLTQTGELLLKTANSVLDVLKQVELEIEKHTHGESGVLRIGTTCMLSYKWLPSVMKRLHDIYPKVDIEMRTSNNFVSDLIERNLDIVIDTITIVHKDFSYESLFKDEIVVIMSPRHILAAKPYLDLPDFNGVNLITFTDSDKGDLYKDYLAPSGIEPAKIMKVDQHQGAIELVIAGFGISLFPKWAVESYIRSGDICARSLTKKGVYYTWKAISVHGDDLPSYQREFIRLIRDIKLAQTN